MKLLLDQNLSPRLSTSEIERRLRSHRDEIETFATEPDTTLLVIEPG